MTSILIFAAGAALLVYSAEKLIVYLVGAASGLHISVFLPAGGDPVLRSTTPVFRNAEIVEMIEWAGAGR